MIKTLALTLALGTAAAFSASPAMAGDKEKSYYKKVEQKDIVATAVGNPDFSTLVTALKQAELVETLQGDGPFTVFAPTNAAFAALPAGTVENLLKPENKEALQKVLTFHVVPAKIKSTDLALGSGQAPTVQGEKLQVTKSEEGVTVNGATVTTADIKTSNGVIHVIDKVLLPSND